MGELRLLLDIPELGELMATVQEVQAALAGLSQHVDQALERVNDDIAKLQATVEQQDLDQDTLDAINTSIGALQSTVDSIDPTPAVDPAEPVDPPTDTPPVDPGTPPADPGDGDGGNGI